VLCIYWTDTIKCTKYTVHTVSILLCSFVSVHLISYSGGFHNYCFAYFQSVQNVTVSLAVQHFKSYQQS